MSTSTPTHAPFTPTTASTGAPTSSSTPEPTDAASIAPMSRLTSAPTRATIAPTPTSTVAPTAASTAESTSAETQVPTHEPAGGPCYIQQCGCPPFTSGEAWCTEANARTSSSWCQERADNCDLCSGTWCAVAATVRRRRPSDLPAESSEREETGVGQSDSLAEPSEREETEVGPSGSPAPPSEREDTEVDEVEVTSSAVVRGPCLLLMAASGALDFLN